MKILVTGATGFIGQHLCQHLTSEGHEVAAVVRSEKATTAATRTILVKDLLDLRGADFQSIDTVIHLAGIAHDYQADKSEYYRINVEGTQHVMACCYESEVKRLIYLSSIKSIAERSRVPLTTNIAPAPEDDYGRSKLGAERLLVNSGALETAILRVPLVYGPGVKGNLRQLVWMASRGIPMPVLSIQNKRSYLGVRNLCDFIQACVTWPTLPCKVFHVSDGAPVSLAGLVRSIGMASGRPSRSFWLPRFMVEVVGMLVLGPRRASKLFGDLELDVTGTTRHTGWYPEYSMQQELDDMFDIG